MNPRQSKRDILTHILAGDPRVQTKGFKAALCKTVECPDARNDIKALTLKPMAYVIKEQAREVVCFEVLPAGRTPSTQMMKVYTRLWVSLNIGGDWSVNLVWANEGPSNPTLSSIDICGHFHSTPKGKVPYEHMGRHKPCPCCTKKHPTVTVAIDWLTLTLGVHREFFLELVAAGRTVSPSAVNPLNSVCEAMVKTAKESYPDALLTAGYNPGMGWFVGNTKKGEEQFLYIEHPGSLEILHAGLMSQEKESVKEGLCSGKIKTFPVSAHP